MKYFRNIKYKIKRVIDFLPIIWNGHDYDSHYAIQLFKYQLQRTADMFDGNHAYGEHAQLNAQKIRTAIRLMDKIYDGEYENEYMDIIDNLYGKTEFNFLSNNDPPNTYRLEVRNPSAVDEKHQKEINDVRYRMSKVSMEKHNRAHRILWKFIEHNIQRWWD
jgi:hypothetical protein